MKGLFAASDFHVRPKPSLIPRCGQCKLLEKCKSPKMPVDGNGRRKILVLGEAPGESEDNTNHPFVGRAGKHLEKALQQHGVNFREDCWIYNAIICRPTNPKGLNRPPSDKEIDYCRPNVIRTIQELQPEIIIPVGGKAVRSLMGWLWRDDVGGMERWAGWQIPCRQLNSWICPTWHPSYLLREGEDKSDERLTEVLDLFWRKHLGKAAALEGRPWKEVPDHSKKLKVCVNVQDAIPFIQKMTRGNKPVAFDFETEGLKPDNHDLRIVSCAMSDGETSIAYPWQGEAIRATQEFLKSDIRKIGYNLKYEERWCLREFGHGVKNGIWDGMLTAHILDNRPMISGLEFQAWVRLGVPPWDHVVAPFMTSKGSNERNRIRECPFPALLKYGATDALLEWEVAHHQAQEMGVKL